MAAFYKYLFISSAKIINRKDSHLIKVEPFLLYLSKVRHPPSIPSASTSA